MSNPLVLRAALRISVKSHFFLLATLAVGLTAVAAFLASQFSGRQPATVGLDVALSALRLAFPLLIILQVQQLVSREFEQRSYLASMTYPIKRHQWLLGRYAALAALVLILLVMTALMLAGLVAWAGQGYSQATPVALGIPYWVTIGFIGADLLVITSMAFLIAVLASTPSFVLIGTLGFMLIARSFAAIITLLSQDTSLVSQSDNYGHALGILGYMLPDLGALDVRAITLYGKMELLPPDWPVLLLSAFAYALGLLTLAVWAFQRKRFA